MAARRRKTKIFQNNKKMGSYVDVNFDIVGEYKHGRENHNFEASIHYYEKGEGSPLLLVHGIGQSLYTWHKNIDFFAENGYKVIAVDLAGFGYSSHPNIYYTIEENAIILNAVLDELGIQNADVVGFSTGALTAVCLAHEFRNNVNKLVLISPGGPNEDYPFALRFLTTRIGHAVFHLWFAESVIEKLLKELFFDKPLVTQNMADQYYAPYKRKGVRDTLAMSMAHFDDMFVLSLLRGTKNETLVLSGENDPVHSLDMIDKYANNIPGAKHIALRNCGHFVHEEKPNRVNSEILLFLENSKAKRAYI